MSTNGEDHLDRLRQTDELRKNHCSQEDGSVFRLALSGPDGMEVVVVTDAAVLLQGFNRQGLQAPGYCKKVELHPDFIGDKDGKPRQNAQGFIHILVHWHGRSPPTVVRVNCKTLNFSTDQRGMGKCGANRPIMAARHWAHEHLRGFEDNYAILEGPTELLEPKEPPLDVCSPRKPKDDEIKRSGRGRPPRPKAPDPVPASDVSLDGLRQFQESRADESRGFTWVETYDSKGALKARYYVSHEDALARLDQELRGKVASERSPAKLLPVERRAEIFATFVGENGRTTEEIISEWSDHQVDATHALYPSCQAHVRSAIRKLRKDGFEYKGARYVVEKPRFVTTTSRDPVTGKKSNRKVKKYCVRAVE